MIDRNEEKHKSTVSRYNDIEIQNPLCDNDDTLNVDSSKEDEEVTEINKLRTIKLTETTPNTDKDIRSRPNLMKYHQMKSMEDSFGQVDELMFNVNDFDKKTKQMSNNERETKTLSGQKTDGICTVETQTDITMPMASGGLLDQYVETSIKRHLTSDPRSRADMELQLLYLQLQYERYRREVMIQNENNNNNNN